VRVQCLGQLGVQPLDALDQPLALARSDHCGPRPALDRVDARRPQLRERRDRLLGTAVAPGDDGEPVAPELAHHLVRHPEPLPQPGQHVEHVLARAVVVPVEVEKHVRVQHDQRRPDGVLQHLLRGHPEAREVVVDADAPAGCRAGHASPFSIA
jgi:hypothetical protein